MDQSNTSKNLLYLFAAVAGAGLIIYGAFFYTKPNAPTGQKAQISSPQDEISAQPMFEDQILGDPSAPVTMVEYASYLCGFCAQFAQETFPLIEEKYINTGKVKFIYRSFPPIELGMALSCAYDQGKFWEYHKFVLDKAISTEDDLTQYAGDLGLVKEDFRVCLANKKYQNQAEYWYNEGHKQGVEGTPTFFINETKIVGALPFAEFEKAIEEALNK
jgi:protein-disulfide isomerase